MIIIPELQKVFIRIPKTASTSFTKAIRKKYPNSFEPYRHMEVDGIPFGYENWERVAIIRDPLERMVSLYNFCKTFEAVEKRHGAGWQEKQRRATSVTFAEWLTKNEIPFCIAVDSNGNHNPFYSTKIDRPENKKSQLYYTGFFTNNFREEQMLFAFEDLKDAAKYLGITLPKEKIKKTTGPVKVTDVVTDKRVLEHIRTVFRWDTNLHEKLLERNHR